MMKDKMSRCDSWVALDSSEMEMIRGGIGLGDIKRILRLIGSLFDFAHEYYDDFKRGYDNGWNLF